MTKTIMFQGTGSDVGKSVLATALCRILAQDNYRVAPFKSQNMALNSYVTRGGGEIGRAQAVQAEAAKVEATVDMNPILLKPKEDIISQLIIHGKAVQNISAQEYFNERRIGLAAIKESLERLKQEYQILVLEGAGSPAEVNLRDYDMVNMKLAQLADAPVILVADIDRGGVFASIIGTFALLNEAEVKRIKGIVINKFRGQIDRLKTGIDYVEKETGVPVLGVVPYFNDFKIPAEDAIPNQIQGAKDYQIDIAVIRLPHIANFTDFDALAAEPKTRVCYVGPEESLTNFDLIIIPGSKNTIEDLEYLSGQGVTEKIINASRAGIEVVGICGGYQMLGSSIADPHGVESERGQIKGLDLLDIETVLASEKITSQVKAKVLANDFFAKDEGDLITGYEIHMGQSKLGASSSPLFKIISRSQQEVTIADGAYSKQAPVWGTYIHDIFNNDKFRRNLINRLRRAKGLKPLTEDKLSLKKERELAYDKLANLVRESLDMEKLYRIIKRGID